MTGVPRFKHILIPLDLSRRTTRALAVAETLLAQGRARVTLLHVIQLIEGMPQGELRGFYRSLETKARRKLESVGRALGRKGVTVRGAVLLGQPAEDIVRHAAENRVDLVVLSSHKPGAGRGRGLGTTSYKVALLCPCPVLLVK